MAAIQAFIREANWNRQAKKSSPAKQQILCDHSTIPPNPGPNPQSKIPGVKQSRIFVSSANLHSPSSQVTPLRLRVSAVKSSPQTAARLTSRKPQSYNRDRESRTAPKTFSNSAAAPLIGHGASWRNPSPRARSPSTSPRAPRKAGSLHLESVLSCLPSASHAPKIPAIRLGTDSVVSLSPTSVSILRRCRQIIFRPVIS